MSELTHGFLTAIANGMLDENLDAVRSAVADRQRVKASLVTAQLRPGDEVRFSESIRPKYLAGMTATVVRRNQASVVVSCPLDPDYGRFSGATGVRCSNSLIEGLAD